MRLPQSIAEDPGLARLWEAANTIVTVWVNSPINIAGSLTEGHVVSGNDILSLPKEVVSLIRE